MTVDIVTHKNPTYLAFVHVPGLSPDCLVFGGVSRNVSILHTCSGFRHRPASSSTSCLPRFWGSQATRGFAVPGQNPWSAASICGWYCRRDGYLSGCNSVTGNTSVTTWFDGCTCTYNKVVLCMGVLIPAAFLSHRLAEPCRNFRPEKGVRSPVSVGRVA